MKSLNTFSLVCFTGLALGQSPNAIYNTNGTSSQPIASNLLQMQGFNFTNLTGNSIVLNPSSETWQLQLNYSIEPLDSLATHRPIIVDSYALRFPEAQLPTQNESTWSLCAHIVQFPFPENITDIAMPAGTMKGDCTPYLGSKCVSDYISAFKAAKRLNNCPIPPLFSQITSCQDRVGRQDVQSIVSASISSWIDPALHYNAENKTYTNTSSGQIVTDPQIRGLRSGEVFWKQGPLPDAINNVTRQREQASTLQFVGFSLSPSQQWIEQFSSFAWVNFSDVRIVCGRANASYNGTITSVSSAGGSVNLAASVARLSPWVALITIAVTAFI